LFIYKIKRPILGAGENIRQFRPGQIRKELKAKKPLWETRVKK
jgi:hypothetical protein